MHRAFQRRSPGVDDFFETSREIIRISTNIHWCTSEALHRYDQEIEHHTNLCQSAIIIDKSYEPAQALFPRGQLISKIMVRPDDFSI